MRFFNTAGACEPDRHYMIPAAERLPDASHLVDQGSYFVVHAPRQTGKTTTLRALVKNLTASGKYAAMWFSCEEGEAAGDDYGAAQRALLGELLLRAPEFLPADLCPPKTIPAGDEGLIAAFFTSW